MACLRGTALSVEPTDGIRGVSAEERPCLCWARLLSEASPEVAPVVSGSPPPPSCLCPRETGACGVSDAHDVEVVAGDLHYWARPFYCGRHGLISDCRGKEGDVEVHFETTVAGFWGAMALKPYFLPCLFWV